MSTNSKNTLPSWMMWVIIITIIVLVMISLLSGGNNSKGNTSKGMVEAETEKIIVLKPGKNIVLEINDKEWSSWIDASYKGMYANVKIQGDRVYQFLDGKIDTVKKDDAVRLPGDVYRIRTVDSTMIAIIKTAMHPINKDLY